MAPKQSKRSASDDDSTSDSGPDDVSFYAEAKIYVQQYVTLCYLVLNNI